MLWKSGQSSREGELRLLSARPSGPRISAVRDELGRNCPSSSEYRDGVRGGSAPQEDRYPVRPVAVAVMEGEVSGGLGLGFGST
jgi:hypothetical protein